MGARHSLWLAALIGFMVAGGLPGVTTPACAADALTVYYVSPDGDDAQPGTRQAPWRTPEHAAETAKAGDTIIFLPGEYSGRLVPANSGTPEAPIVFRAEQRRTARLIGHAPGEFVVGPSGSQSLAGGARIEIVGRSHIQVHGFEVQDTGGSASEGGWARIFDSSHIAVADCAFSGGYVYQCFRVEGSEQVRILDNDMARDARASDMWLVTHSRGILIEGNSFSRTGHGPGVLRYTQRAIVRGNVFHAGWARNFSIGPDTCSEILVEGNIFANQFNGGSSAGPVNQIVGERLIFRFNTTFDACGLAWNYQGASKVPHLHNRTYHNVFHGNHGVALFAGTRYTNFRDMAIQNNVFSGNDPYASGTQVWLTGGDSTRVRLVRNVLNSGSEGTGALMLYGRTPLSRASAQGRDRWASQLEQPITQASAAGAGRRLPVGDASAFERLIREGAGPALITVGGDESLAAVTGVEGEHGMLHLDRDISWPADAPVTLLTGPADEGMFVDNLETDPRFADPAGLDFSPAEGSRCPPHGDGRGGRGASAAGPGPLPILRWLRNRGRAGRLGSRRFAGEPCACGRGGCRGRRAAAGLDRDLQWAGAAPVSFPWSGAAPDIGIIEHGDGGRPCVQVLAQPVRTQAGENTVLRAVARGLTRPLEYSWQLGDGATAEGETVTHGYSEARDYGVRVRVTDANGQHVVGVGYVDARPAPAEDGLVHTTFDRDDPDWFVHWQLYRGRRDTGSSSYRQVIDEATGAGHVRVYPRGEAPWVLPAFIRPRGWDIDKYPHVRIRYQIRSGTPVAMFVRPFPSAWYTLWDMDSAQDSRRYYFAGTADVLDRAPVAEGAEQMRGRGPLPDGPFPQQLVADGEWHEISFDVRDIRTKYPDVQVLQALDIGDLAIDGGKQVGSRDEFRLDDVYIGR